jgi:hypothetical protein
LLSGPSFDEVAFSGNSLIGHDNSVYGVWIESDADDGAHRAPAMDENRYEGFKTPVSYAPRRVEEKPKNASP